MLQFRTAGESNVGLVRTHNEDSAFAGPSLVLVADGVGGAAAGEVASSTAVLVASALAREPGDDDPLAVLALAVLRSAEQLRAGVEAHPGRAGMGTTLTAVYTDGVRCGLAHVGDSRAYRLRGGRLEQLTADHTLVQALVDAGRLTPDQARASVHRHIVTRALGSTTAPEPDVGWLDLAAGDRLLLCSDGLTDLVTDDVIAALLGGDSCEEAASHLVGVALEHGGRDNVTVLVADVVDDPDVARTGSLLGAAAEPERAAEPG